MGSKRILKTTMHAVARNNTSGFWVTSTAAAPEYNGSYYDTNTHSNVNILLAGGVILVVLILCYCCHKNVRKHRQHENSQHRRVEPDDHNLEVFAMDTMLQQCSERSTSQTSHSTFVTSEPPPAYESIFDPRAVPSPIDKKDESDDLGSIIAPRTGSFPTELEANWINKRENVPRDDQGLPSYEAALKLESDGYV